MKSRIATLLLLLALLLFAAPAVAQVTVHYVSRVVVAEIAYIEDGQVGEHLQVSKFSPAVGEWSAGGEMPLDDAMSYAHQVTTVSVGSDTLRVGGRFVVGHVQPGDKRHFFHSWAFAGGEFSVAGATDFRIRGSRSWRAEAWLALLDSETGTNRRILLQQGDFDAAERIDVPGRYRFHIYLSRFDLPWAAEAEEDFMDFSFELVSAAGVPTADSSWGAVKSLYR